MIYDIITVNSYLTYKKHRGPFVFIFYKPNDQVNKKIFLKLREITNEFYDVPLMRFDWNNFKKRFPKESKNHNDILVIEKEKLNYYESTTNIYKMRQILKYVSERRSQLRRQHNGEFAKGIRKKPGKWSPYARMYSNSKTGENQLEIDHCKYKFPNEIPFRFKNDFRPKYEEHLKKQKIFRLKRCTRLFQKIKEDKCDFELNSNQSNREPAIKKHYFRFLNSDKILIEPSSYKSNVFENSYKGSELFKENKKSMVVTQPRAQNQNLLTMKLLNDDQQSMKTNLDIFTEQKSDIETQESINGISENTEKHELNIKTINFDHNYYKCNNTKEIEITDWDKISSNLSYKNMGYIHKKFKK